MFPPPDDVSSRLAAALHPADLDRRPAAFRRLVEHRLKGVGRPAQVATQRVVEGASRMRVLRIGRQPGKGGREWLTLLLWTEGRRVLAQTVSTGNDFELAWEPVQWRARGDRLVGLNLFMHGNGCQPCAVVLRKEHGRWKQQSLRFAPDEGWDIWFRDAKGWDVAFRRRSYDFRALSAPHAGPLLTETGVWRFRGDRFFMPRPFRRTSNALDAFDRLVARVEDGDWAYVRQVVPRAEIRRRLVAEVQASSGGRSVTCPHSYNIEMGRVFGINNRNAAPDKPRRFYVLALHRGRWRVIRTASEGAFPKPRIP